MSDQAAAPAADPEAPADPFGKVKEFAELFLQEKDLQAQLEAVKAKRKRLAPEAEQQLLAMGLKNAPLSTGATVMRETKLWAGAARVQVDGVDTDDPDTERAVAALDEAGMGDYAPRGVNTQGLSAYFRSLRTELEEQRAQEAKDAGLDPVLAADVELDELLPDALKGAIRLTEVHTLKAVRNQ